MKLSENPPAIEWLGQFNSTDVHAARFIIDSLKLVSFTEYESVILRNLSTVLDATEGKVALLTVDEGLGEPKGLPGSEYRLLNTFTNFSRNRGDRILVSPTEEEMLEEKVDAIVLVDDFVASGTRLCGFWENWASKRIKCWLSLKYCDLWIAGYAIHKKGLDRVSKLRSVDTKRLLFDVHLETHSDYWPPSVVEFLEHQAERTTYVPFSSNFGEINCPLVFQHGCPDNAPVILIEAGTGYTPLFIGRSIAPSFYPCFDAYIDSWRGPELLIRGGQPLLAEGLIQEFSNGASHTQIQLLTILGLLTRGVSAERLPSVMTASLTEIEQLLESGQCLGLIDNDRGVTPFGKDLVTRSKRRFFPTPSQRKDTDDDATYYIPKQFLKRSCGAQ